MKPCATPGRMPSVNPMCRVMCWLPHYQSGLDSSVPARGGGGRRQRRRDVRRGDRRAQVRIPAVMGTADGTTRLEDGQRVRVAGTRGLVIGI
jgi:hypothetical protein